MSNFLKGEPNTITWDHGEPGSVKGLHLKNTAAKEGAIKRTFYLYYQTKTGIRRRPKIGELGTEIDLSTARKIAREWLGLVAAGLDPSGERQADRREHTLDQAFNACLKDHWGLPQYQASTWGKQAERIYKRSIKPKFGNKRLSEITAASVREWHGDHRATPYAGNRALRILSKIFNFSVEKEWAPQHSNPCSLVKAFKEEKRDRFATPQEISKIGAILEREAFKHPREVAFIYMLLLTGSRPSALERLTWDQITVHEGYGIVKFDGKTGKETLVIPFQAMKMLLELPKTPGQTVFGIKQPVAFWNTIRKELGAPDLWARDLRRTFATIGMSHGHNMGIISELLNHKTTQTTMVYAKLQDQVRVDTAESIASRMESLLRPSSVKH